MSEEIDGPTFTHDGVKYPFDPARMSGLEVIALESKTGMTFMEWIEAMEKLRADAVRWLIWVSLTRADKQPACKYSEFDYDYVGFLGSLEGVEDAEPDPTPARAVRRASQKKSNSTARSSATTAAG